MADIKLDQVSNALPEKFPFYHLGEIRLATGASAGLADHEISERTFAIALRGDISAVLLVSVDEALDASTYAEAGNIIASQLATRLDRELGIDVLISPPSEIAPSRVRAMIESVPADRRAEKSYIHRQPGGPALIPIRTILLGVERND